MNIPSVPPSLARGLRQIAYTLALVLLLKSCTPWLEAAETPSVAVNVRPKFTLVTPGQSTASVSIRVTVPRNPQNRLLCVEIDGTMYRSSCWEHLGSGATVQEFQYRDVLVGDYEVLATLEWVEEGSGKRRSTIGRNTFRIMDGQPSEF